MKNRFETSTGTERIPVQSDERLTAVLPHVLLVFTPPPPEGGPCLSGLKSFCLVRWPPRGGRLILLPRPGPARPLQIRDPPGFDEERLF